MMSASTMILVAFLELFCGMTVSTVSSDDSSTTVALPSIVLLDFVKTSVKPPALPVLKAKLVPVPLLCLYILIQRFWKGGIISKIAIMSDKKPGNINKKPAKGKKITLIST